MERSKEEMAKKNSARKEQKADYELDTYKS